MSKYDFASMQIGSSRFYPDQPKRTQSAVCLAAHAFSRSRGREWRFVTRSEGSGVRIWRVHQNPNARKPGAIPVPQIETGIPVPGSKRGPPTKYKFAELRVGDSIMFPNERLGVRSKPACAAGVFASRMRQSGVEWRVSIRKEGAGVRIWRTA